MSIRFTLIALLLSLATIAQERSNYKVRNNNIASADTLSLLDQYDFLSNNSDSYREYKVIKKDWLRRVRKHLSDSLVQTRRSIKALTDDLSSHNMVIDSLNQKVESLEKINSRKDKVHFLGTSMEKSTYHIILWSLIALAIVFTLYYFYQYKNAHKVTKDAIDRFNELDEEFNTARTKALEREQVLNRKVLDAERKINELSKDS
ncbi:MAG: hypothetical protein CR968_04290 [Flavobacteriia bacterium]|nr:MAG: hypothetical protein CR968_04290 [Flavobacteriia bacterium]